MKTCTDWREPLLDHALGQPPRAGLEEHLSQCAACRQALAKLCGQGQQLEAEIRALVAAEPGPYLSARLLAALTAASARTPWAVPWKPVLAVLAVLLTLGASVFALQEARKKQEQETLAAVATLSQWRSPTEALLQSPGQAFLRTTPRLGETFFPLPAAGGKSERENRFMQKGGNNAS